MAPLKKSIAPSSAAAVTDVVVIGAGPAGSMAACLLAGRGLSVCVLERERFPRYKVGESLLPRCNVLMAEVGVLDAVKRHGFMVKGGATFADASRGVTRLRFADGRPGDPPSSFQVPRAEFDALLARCAEERGATVLFNATVDAINFDRGSDYSTEVHWSETEDRPAGQLRCRFVLDASGAGRVLQRTATRAGSSALAAARPGGSAQEATAEQLGCRRRATFGIFDAAACASYDHGGAAGDILITSNEAAGLWGWRIPFADGRCSVGAVSEVGSDEPAGASTEQVFAAAATHLPRLSVYAEASAMVPGIMMTQGWTTSTTAQVGPGWARVGDSAGFIDPIFSSGVLMAMEASVRAGKCIAAQLAGEAVDWQAVYLLPLRRAAQVFAALVSAWYDGILGDVFHASAPPPEVRAALISVLGGNVFDNDDNPLLRDTARQLHALQRLTVSRA